MRMIDMHCHLDRIADAIDVADELATREIGVFCTTVAPSDTLTARELFEAHSNVCVGVGLHPYWISSEPDFQSTIEQACSLAVQARFVGEIGLDFSDAHKATSSVQVGAFEQLMSTCSSNPVDGRVLSIHAVKSAAHVLDILERSDVVRSSSCIFHWFSGTSEDFVRLRDLGCYISVNERMLATRKGREYARQIPLEQLLIETDAPPQLDTTYSATEIEQELRRTLEELSAIRVTSTEMLRETITATSEQLLGL